MEPNQAQQALPGRGKKRKKEKTSMDTEKKGEKRRIRCWSAIEASSTCVGPLKVSLSLTNSTLLIEAGRPRNPLKFGRYNMC
jgi:hypothetical protein